MARPELRKLLRGAPADAVRAVLSLLPDPAAIVDEDERVVLAYPDPSEPVGVVGIPLGGLRPRPAPVGSADEPGPAAQPACPMPGAVLNRRG